MSDGRGLCCAALLGALSALPATTHADINLELRVSSSTVRVGDAVEVGLYAVSDDETDQPFAGLDAMIGWDTDALRLIKFVDDGITWIQFEQDDCDLDQLSNELCPPNPGCLSSGGAPCNDGDARLTMWRLPDAIATPEGALAATFVFQAIDPASSARVWLIPIAGPVSETRVISGNPEDPLLTGTLGELFVSISLCGTRGDFDGDCRVELFPDHFYFAECMNGPDGSPLPVACDPADFNGDGVADMLDAAAFQREFTGP